MSSGFPFLGLMTRAIQRSPLNPVPSGIGLIGGLPCSLHIFDNVRLSTIARLSYILESKTESLFHFVVPHLKAHEYFKYWSESGG